MTSLAHIDLNTLVVFDAVADSGGFTAAAHRLGVAKAKVSLQISRLEASIGASLFTRTTRQVHLTDAGRALHAQCQPLLRGLQEAFDENGANAGLSGTLRLSTTVDHAIQSLAPALAHFAEQHPSLQIELRTSDRVVDLVGEGLDVTIRMGWLRDSSLHAVKLGSFGQCLVAAPDYVRRRGQPQQPADLLKFDWIALTLLPTPLSWKFTGPSGAVQSVQVASRLRVDSPGVLRALLQQGMGLSVLDEHTAADDLRAGRLVRLMAGWSLPAGGVYAVHAPGRHTSRKVRTFIDFYRDHLAARAQADLASARR